MTEIFVDSDSAKVQMQRFAGDIGRDPGIGVLVPVGLRECFFLCSFEILRCRVPKDLGIQDDFKFLVFLKGSYAGSTLKAYLLPLEDAQTESLDSALALFFASSSLRLSISLCFSHPMYHPRSDNH